MTKYQKLYLLLLRLAFGWIFLYSGFTKILNPNWTALEYIKNAQTLSFFYHWLSNSQNIGWVNALNEWGQLAIGLSLISGVFVRGAAIGGILLMVMYYLPILNFPLVGTHSFLVDEHVIYILIFLVLFVFDKEMKKFKLVLPLGRYARSLFSPSQKSRPGQK